MALINCPECGKEVSDKASVCIHCGFPLDEIKENLNIQCPHCGAENPANADYCSVCEMRITPYGTLPQEEEKKKFTGVYRMTLFSGKQEVYCPRCKSEDCSHYQEQKYVPEKTKTRYTVNLNPLKPFTLVNKKEKVTKKSKTLTEKKFICNSCGHIFL